LATARKSYLGYLVRRSVGDNVADVSFTDGSGKLVYDFTKRQRAEFYAVGGHSDLSHAAPASSNNPNHLQSGGNDFTLVRAGWRFAATPDLLVTAHSAYIRQKYDTENPFHNTLRAEYYGEWLGGASAVWNWSKQQESDAGFTVRRLRDNFSRILYSSNHGPSVTSHDGTALRHSGYLQHASSLLRNRVRLSGGLRWDHLEGVASTFTSPQAALSLRASPSTDVQLGFGRYAQFPDIAAVLPPCGPFALLIDRSDHCTAALEQRIGENWRVNVHSMIILNAQPSVALRSFLQVSSAATRAESNSCCSVAAPIDCLDGSDIRLPTRGSASISNPSTRLRPTTSGTRLTPSPATG
jgi:hypothetical protein